eukprot:683654-Hanusia_phi.AAC.1
MQAAADDTDYLRVQVDQTRFKMQFLRNGWSDEDDQLVKIALRGALNSSDLATSLEAEISDRRSKITKGMF